MLELVLIKSKKFSWETLLVLELVKLPLVRRLWRLEFQRPQFVQPSTKFVLLVWRLWNLLPWVWPLEWVRLLWQGGWRACPTFPFTFVVDQSRSVTKQWKMESWRMDCGTFTMTFIWACAPKRRLKRYAHDYTGSNVSLVQLYKRTTRWVRHQFVQTCSKCLEQGCICQWNCPRHSQGQEEDHCHFRRWRVQKNWLCSRSYSQFSL